jgi:hypothetical protein
LTEIAASYCPEDGVGMATKRSKISSRLHGGACQKTVFFKYRTWGFPAVQASVPVLAVYSASLGQFATVIGVVKENPPCPVFTGCLAVGIVSGVSAWSNASLRYVFDFFERRSRN